MDYATSMGFVQRIRNLRAEFQYLLQRSAPFSKRFASVSPSTHSITR